MTFVPILKIFNLISWYVGGVATIFGGFIITQEMQVLCPLRNFVIKWSGRGDWSEPWSFECIDQTHTANPSPRQSIHHIVRILNTFLNSRHDYYNFELNISKPKFSIQHTTNSHSNSFRHFVIQLPWIVTCSNSGLSMTSTPMTWQFRHEDKGWHMHCLPSHATNIVAHKNPAMVYA